MLFLYPCSLACGFEQVVAKADPPPPRLNFGVQWLVTRGQSVLICLDGNAELSHYFQQQIVFLLGIICI